jgi:hypothetical protein
LQNPTLFIGSDGAALQQELKTALVKAHTATAATTQVGGNPVGATVSTGATS